jgi:hypothetical protein
MPRCAVLFWLAATMLAQEPFSKADMLSLVDQLKAATQSGDWKKAAELSTRLREAVLSQRNRSLSREANEQISKVLTWLPEDTETVVVVSEPFSLPKSDADPPADTFASARQYTLFPLYGTTWERNLSGRTLRFAAIAARKFRNHEPGKNDALPLGLIAYEGCGVYAFAKPMDESVLQPPQTSILGHPIWEGKVEDENQDAPVAETYFASLLKSDIIIACNNRDFLTQVLSRLDGPPSAEAFPSSLPEWKHVDRSKPFWGLRHFRSERATEDPTYPGNGLISEERNAAPVGVAIDVDSSGGSISARFISASKVDPWKDLAEAQDFQGRAKTRQIAPDVWELSVSAEKEAGMFGIFALLGVLGFVILI